MRVSQLKQQNLSPSVRITRKSDSTLETELFCRMTTRKLLDPRFPLI